jgi:transposase
MAKRRKRYESGFKARVALEALRERETVAGISKRFGVHSTLIHQWKKRLVEEAGTVFDGVEKRTEEIVSQAELYEQIGRLNVELDWLKKKVAKGGI